MSKLPSIPIFWSDHLYTETAQTKINSSLDSDPDLLALIGRHTTKVFTFCDILNVVNLQAPEQLRKTSKGPRLIKQDSLLKGIPAREFPFKDHLWVGDRDDDHWCIIMHRDIVLAVPGLARDRNNKTTFEDRSIAILAKPTSAHDKIGFPARIERICHEAAGMIGFAWKSGFQIRDCDAYSGASNWILKPS